MVNASLCTVELWISVQRKLVSDSSGLVDFAQRASEFFRGNSNYRRTVINAVHQKNFWALKKTLGLVHTSNNLPEWQAVKPTFFAPCGCTCEMSNGRIAKLTRTWLIVYWSHQHVQWEYVAHSLYWIWLGKYSSCVIKTY